MTWYERLSAQDASFLVYEDHDAAAHMHVGGLSVYEAGALSSATGGVDVERFRAYVASRLHMIPRYRQRLAAMPLSGDPIWIDDDHFNVRYHIRHTRLPRPGRGAPVQLMPPRDRAAKAGTAWGSKIASPDPVARIGPACPTSGGGSAWYSRNSGFSII